MTRLSALLGLDTQPSSWSERVLATLGGALAIYLILISSQAILGADALPIVASMGASAVLIFAVPHGQLSQPWPLLGGHLCSSLVGVTCAQQLGATFPSAALAVGLSIGLMHLLRCTHPPGGASALFAVLGGAGVHDLGYVYVLSPILLNSLLMLLVAIVFNYPFAQRRYPAVLASQPVTDVLYEQRIDHEDLVRALSEMDTFIDVTEQDLLRIYDIATHNQHEQHRIHSTDIQPGLFFSNGREGSQWQVREVIEIRELNAGSRSIISYRIAAGSGHNLSGKASLHEFTRWCRFQVQWRDDHWQRITP